MLLLSKSPVSLEESEGEHLYGLDTIRFLCALWVFFSHLGIPPINAGIYGTWSAEWIVRGLTNNMWNGPAAVIVFFVISGLCIHYPAARSGERVDLLSFYTRRFVRIGVPLFAAISLSGGLGLSLSLFHDSILWSLLAELVYYLIYPVLLLVRRQAGSWVALIIPSFVLAWAVAATDPSASNYPSFGFGLNWLLGLPCWVLGCWLAERIARHANLAIPFNINIWVVRVMLWGVSMGLSVMRFHGPLGYPWTLNIFALLVCFWLALEIEHFRTKAPNGVLEWGGRWSYSLYLTHLLALRIYAFLSVPTLGVWLDWSLQVAWVCLVAYLFYLSIEWPAHSGARYLARALREKRKRPEFKPAELGGGG